MSDKNYLVPLNFMKYHYVKKLQNIISCHKCYITSWNKTSDPRKSPYVRHYVTKKYSVMSQNITLVPVMPWNVTSHHDMSRFTKSHYVTKYMYAMSWFVTKCNSKSGHGCYIRSCQALFILSCLKINITLWRLLKDTKKSSVLHAEIFSLHSNYQFLIFFSHVFQCILFSFFWCCEKQSEWRISLLPPHLRRPPSRLDNFLMALRLMANQRWFTSPCDRKFN